MTLWCHFNLPCFGPSLRHLFTSNPKEIDLNRKHLFPSGVFLLLLALGLWLVSSPAPLQAETHVPLSALSPDSARASVSGPEIAVDPAEMVVSQTVAAVVSYPLTISNLGDEDLGWTIIEELPAVSGPSSSDPQRLGIPAARTAPLDGLDTNGFSETIVTDGGFEADPPSPFWNEASTNFGTPLCTEPACGLGGGSGPHSGSWWLWLGGIAAYEEGSVDQDVTIPLGTATLTFWLEVPVACTNDTDYVEVLIDGEPVFLVDGTSPLCGVGGYSLQTVDITAYADGGVHNLEFHSEIFGGGVTNFFVDDVAIDVDELPPPTCSSPTDYPWVSISQTSGTTAAGASSELLVTFDATGLTVGSTYTGTLCIDSNDPLTPLTRVPLSLTVTAQVYDTYLPILLKP